jgi:hypothetical protein
LRRSCEVRRKVVEVDRLQLRRARMAGLESLEFGI